MVHKVTSKSDLEAKLNEAGEKLVVIDFYATWCGPCKTIAPILEKIGQDNPDSLFIMKVDVDEHNDLSEEYKIQVMPTFVLMRKGKHLDTITGSSEQKLRDLIEKHL